MAQVQVIRIADLGHHEFLAIFRVFEHELPVLNLHHAQNVAPDVRREIFEEAARHVNDLPMNRLAGRVVTAAYVRDKWRLYKRVFSMYERKIFANPDYNLSSTHNKTLVYLAHMNRLRGYMRNKQG
ncbi:hypothetical protein QAD02_002882 [Eretmocerus hayati]|uniref:Uncharacterized protein n=1 Tax=Eretmocerus hayati TaxID=131215 RepID=A0ACC2NL44_9HYME|nr:hypothetical protein QAD02_002882 [Eretmocerus hayati]